MIQKKIKIDKEQLLLWLCTIFLVHIYIQRTSIMYLLPNIKQYFIFRGQVQWVRLGDLDLDSGSDTKRDYQIIRRIFHPDYKPPSVYNDIGLVQLEEPVTFTPFIKPACLFSSDISQYIDLIATGWGLTQLGGESNTLQKIYLDLFTPEECTNTYKSISNSRRLPYGIQHDQQFCAGGRGLEKDTCQVRFERLNLLIAFDKYSYSYSYSCLLFRK